MFWNSLLFSKCYMKLAYIITPAGDKSAFEYPIFWLCLPAHGIWAWGSWELIEEKNMFGMKGFRPRLGVSILLTSLYYRNGQMPRCIMSRLFWHTYCVTYLWTFASSKLADFFIYCLAVNALINEKVLNL